MIKGIYIVRNLNPVGSGTRRPFAPRLYELQGLSGRFSTDGAGLMELMGKTKALVTIFYLRDLHKK